MKAYVYRYFWFTAGLFINSMGIALITKAALGTSPISSLPYVLSLRFPLSFGQFTFIINMFFILGQILLLRSRFQPLQLLQIGVNLVFSLCIDLGMSLFFWFSPQCLFTQLAALLAGCLVLAFGLCIEVAPSVLMVPGEGLVSAISQVSKKRFGSVKVLFDSSLVLMALILSLTFFHRLSGLGLGTLISALLVGRFVNMIHQRLPLVKYIARLSREQARL